MFPCLRSPASFTWSSSRLDRNLITLITGQAVETFDLQFCDLYLESRGVSLNKVPMVDEPIPEYVPHVAPPPVSAAIARKLINPKYALVTMGTHKSPTSSDPNSSNRNSQLPTGMKFMKKRVRHVFEEPPLHPGLAHLEKVYLIPYLPIWPEPDPPSDVIGFINIRDDRRANQVHLQRSERFETSKAIRFSVPLLAEKAPASGGDAKAAQPAEKVSGNTSLKVSTPVSPTVKRPKEETHSAPKGDRTDAAASSGPPEQPGAPTSPDTHKPAAPPPSDVTAGSQPAHTDDRTPETQTAAPPVPKRRTLQLVIDPASSEQPDQSQVSLMKMDPSHGPAGFEAKGTGEEPAPGRATAKDDGGDSGSTGDGSQDSTKVLCDRAVDDAPSSNSTASEEDFYDCSQAEPRDPLVNGATTASGRGDRQGDGVNMMARLSQSMLDLRPSSQMEDATDLIRQSQQLRRQGQQPPHRHIGQVLSYIDIY